MAKGENNKPRPKVSYPEVLEQQGVKLIPQDPPRSRKPETPAIAPKEDKEQ